MFDFNNYLARSKCHDNSNKLVAGIMEDKQLVLRLKNLLD